MFHYVYTTFSDVDNTNKGGGARAVACHNSVEKLVHYDLLSLFFGEFSSACVCVSAVLFKDRPFPIDKHHFSTRRRRPSVVFDAVAQSGSDVGRK
jgi:hypothetical protein